MLGEEVPHMWFSRENSKVGNEDVDNELTPRPEMPLDTCQAMLQILSLQ
jgi:hypothetical protein